MRLALRGVGLRFGRVRALDDVTLGVKPGEIIALLGDSGCGKSTLLRAVAGLDEPDEGQVVLDGTAVNRRVPAEARGVGLMFQDYALFPHLTVAENVAFGLHRLPKGEAQGIVAARLGQVGLTDRAGSYPGTLSGGESQRVALARALAPGPRILLLDEPFSNLDRRTRDWVRADTLAVLRATRATALMVTHDPEEALSVADRIALMRAGRIVQTGTGEDLYRRPASRFAARFFGDLIEWPGRCRDGQVATPFGGLPASGFREGEAVVVCVRPEAIRLSPPGAGPTTGRVLARRFLGATAALEIAVDGVEAPWPLTVPCAQAWRAGDRIGLALAEDGWFIFADGVD